jgi:pyruvate dehydrogenase E1 component beta subunit
VFISHLGLLDTRGQVSDPPSRIELGRAEIKRSGRDITIVAVSIMVPRALEAAETLAARGVDAEVLDVRCLVPFDRALLLESVEKTGRLVIAEEGQLSCGVGAEIAAIVAERAFSSLRAPIRRVAVPDCPIPASPRLKSFVEPGSAEIVAAVSSVLELTGARSRDSDFADTET